MDAVIDSLDSTEKHLAFLKEVSDHCTSYIAAIALAYSTKPSNSA
jgi:hypothetical protein